MELEPLARVRGYPLMWMLENPKGRKLMILLHGYTGNYMGPDGMFQVLSEKLQKQGYAVLRFNFRGNPPSGMPFSRITLKTGVEDLKAVLRLARRRGYRRVGLLGESMGGIVAVNGCPGWLRALVLWYSDFWPMRNVARIKCPVLFIHGSRDRSVLHSRSEKAFTLAREPKQIAILKGVGHCFRKHENEENNKLNRQQKRAINLTVRFLEKHF